MNGLTGEGVFPIAGLTEFRRAYPETAYRLNHRLTEHPLLSLDALATLAEGLPAASVEYNRGDIPIGVEEKPSGNGLGIGDTVRRIETSASWAALKNIEQFPDYNSLIGDLLEELRAATEAATGPMLKTQGFVFVSSPSR